MGEVSRIGSLSVRVITCGCEYVYWGRTQGSVQLVINTAHIVLCVIYYSIGLAFFSIADYFTDGRSDLLRQVNQEAHVYTHGSKYQNIVLSILSVPEFEPLACVKSNLLIFLFVCLII